MSPKKRPVREAAFAGLAPLNLGRHVTSVERAINDFDFEAAYGSLGAAVRQLNINIRR